MSRLYPSNVEPRRRTGLRPDDIDRVASALMTLTKELWVVKDRQAVTEAVLKARGIDIAAEIDRHQPDAALEARLAAERQTLVKRITQELTGELEPMS
jgi:hypothetical protein